MEDLEANHNVVLLAIGHVGNWLTLIGWGLGTDMFDLLKGIYLIILCYILLLDAGSLLLEKYFIKMVQNYS